MATKRKILGVTGDVNALDYGGGIVWDQGYGPEWFVWDEPEEDDGKYSDYEVYRVGVPKDVFEYHSWADPFKIGSSVGENPLKIAQSGSSRHVMDRVHALEDIAGHYGIRSLDDEPQMYTRAEMVRKFGPSFRAALK